jgi:NADH-quinone oxidoreductase subunit L
MTVRLLVLVPIAASVAVFLVSRLHAVIAAGALASTAALGLSAAATEATSSLAWGPKLELSVAATDFARAVVVLVPVIALPIVIYAAATETSGRIRLIALLTAFVGAMELLVLANDFLSLLIGWELVGALSWVLIAHEWREAAYRRRRTLSSQHAPPTSASTWPPA